MSISSEFDISTELGLATELLHRELVCVPEPKVNIPEPKANVSELFLDKI